MNNFNCNVEQNELKILENYVTLIKVPKSLASLNTTYLYGCD